MSAFGTKLVKEYTDINEGIQASWEHYQRHQKKNSFADDCNSDEDEEQDEHESESSPVFKLTDVANFFDIMCRYAAKIVMVRGDFMFY